MSSNNESCTDTEFIQLWGQLQSAQKVAQHLGINIRAVHLRRRNMEKFYNMSLIASDHRGVKYDKNRPKSFSPLKQIELGIEDGCVIIFSDAHFIPGQRTTAFKGLIWAIQEFKP
jgi:hypothetical protein